jgi:hypothetical protein
MKKAAVLSLTAFYLLLTTGMFVCIVHCSAERLFEKPAMQMGHASARHHQKKNCKGGNNCDCCKKHGNYVIKENIQSFSTFKMPQSAALIPYQTQLYAGAYNRIITSLALPESKAPPDLSGKSLVIKLRTILI